MAINQNHLFEELDGIKCAIVEKNVSPERVDFLRQILEYNRFTVVVVPSPPPKVVAAPAPARPAAPAATEQSAPPAPAPATEPPVPIAPPPPPPPPPATFTIGVTDTMFNPVNAIFGRLLRTRDGHFVTLAYWQQKDERSNDAIPYFNQR